jgi:lysyl-tRNA synthetase class II
MEASKEEPAKQQEKPAKPQQQRNGAQVAMRALCDKLDKINPDFSMSVAERITNLRQTPGAAFVPLKAMDEKQIQCVQRDCSAIAVMETKEAIEEMLNDWERIKKEGDA